MESDTARTTQPAHPARVVIQAWIASRGLIAVVALTIALKDGRTLTELVSNWDVQHFVALAEGGYSAEPDNLLMAFFPGLPVLLSLFADLGIPMVVSGVVISAVGSAFAAAALYRIGGRWAAVAWLFAPTAVFTTVPYTESLFCAVAFWAWERARADRWFAAAVLVALACTLRVSGLFLVGALVVMIITEWVDVPTTAKRVGLMLLPASVIGGFATYLFFLTGSWTAWYQAQSTGWVRSLTTPWQSFKNTIPTIVPGAFADQPWWAAVFRGELISMVVGLAVTLWCIVVSVQSMRRSRGSRDARAGAPSGSFARTGAETSPTERITKHGDRFWAEGSWVGVQVLAFSLSYWFFSVNRATLLWFPLWMVIGRLVGRQPRTGGQTIACRGLVALAFTTEITLMLWWSWLFFTGHWAS